MHDREILQRCDDSVMAVVDGAPQLLRRARGFVPLGVALPMTEAIGLALDGTGYGTDGKIWGGEVLIARLDGFERFAHLEYVPMRGGMRR